MQHQSHQRKRSLADFHSESDPYMCELSGSNAGTSYNSHHMSLNFDESFEPIALVTPPKKRAHTDTGTFSYNNYGHTNLSSSYFDILQQQRRNSLQHFQPQQRRDSFLESCNALFQGSVLNSLDPLPYSSSLHPPMSPLNRPMDVSMHGYASSTYNNSLYPSTAFASTDITSDMLGPLLHDANSQSIRLSNNVSFSTDERDNQTCPDLCESSSSLLDEGNFIIQTSDSFKENNFAKAEIIPAGDLVTLNMLTNIVGQSDTTPIMNAPSGQEKVNVTTTHNPNKNEQDTASARFKPFHEEKWSFHYDELLQFKKENGHCLVPHTFPAKPHLARWVKRQRRQYKLKLEGNMNSTMTDDRIKILNDIGFVWDSHEVIWNERFHQLVRYKEQYGNCKVPSYCKECPQLASWVKCQRRQYKLFWEEGKGSSMTTDRIKLLNSIGFIWEVHPGRKNPKDDEHYQHLATILMDGKS